MNTSIGRVYWVTGLAGAGKTTLGLILREEIIRNTGLAPVFIDGDEIRAAFGNKFGYEEADRRELAFSYSRLCNLFSKQGFDVICCTISMFHDVRDWNRENFVNYKEIYLEVDEQELKARNQKQLYTKNLSDELTVVGLNSSFEAPRKADLTIQNNGKKELGELLHIHLKDIVK